jgi:hypothetical protein
VVQGGREQRGEGQRGRARAVLGKGMDLTSVVCVSVRVEREGESGKMRNLAEKVYSEECAKGAWADF